MQIKIAQFLIKLFGTRLTFLFMNTLNVERSSKHCKMYLETFTETKFINYLIMSSRRNFFKRYFIYCTFRQMKFSIVFDCFSHNEFIDVLLLLF